MKASFKSLKATNNIAQGKANENERNRGTELPKRPDAESVEQINAVLLLTVSERLNFSCVPGDSRWAMMFVAFGDLDYRVFILLLSEYNPASASESRRLSGRTRIPIVFRCR